METVTSTIEAEEINLGLSNLESSFDYAEVEVVELDAGEEQNENPVELEGELSVEGVIDELGKNLLLDGKEFKTGDPTLTIEIIDGVLLAYGSNKTEVVAEREVMDTENGTAYKALYYTDGKGGWSLRIKEIEQTENVHTASEASDAEEEAAEHFTNTSTEQEFLTDSEPTTPSAAVEGLKWFQSVSELEDNTPEQEHFFENIFTPTQVDEIEKAEETKQPPIEELSVVEELRAEEPLAPIPVIEFSDTIEDAILNIIEDHEPITIVQDSIENFVGPEITPSPQLDVKTGISINITKPNTETIATPATISSIELSDTSYKKELAAKTEARPTTVVEELRPVRRVVKSIKVTGISISIKKMSPKKTLTIPEPVIAHIESVQTEQQMVVEAATETEEDQSLPTIELSPAITITNVSEPIKSPAKESGITVITLPAPARTALRAKAKPAAEYDINVQLPHEANQEPRVEAETLPAYIGVEAPPEFQPAIIERATSVSTETILDTVEETEVLETEVSIEPITISFVQPIKTAATLHQGRAPAQGKPLKTRLLQSPSRKRARRTTSPTPQPITINFGPAMQYQTVTTLAQVA